MSNTFGSYFKTTTFGESHGPAIGAVIDGCPARLPLSAQDIQPQLNRRRPGQTDLTTPRQETDKVKLLSGVENGLTLGSSIALVIESLDQKPSDYAILNKVPRPSHSDFTYRAKYGIASASGGGRASARETAARVAAGAVAEKLLDCLFGVEVIAWVSSVGTIVSPDLTSSPITRADVDAFPIRCPAPETAQKMAQAILQAREKKDSLGGIITCVCRNVPPGWGEPVFNKLDAMLAHAMFSLPAVKGFEVGAGIAGTAQRGSKLNDPFMLKDGKLHPKTNHSGGIQGGISNGAQIVMKAAFKPVSSIGQTQTTTAYDGSQVNLNIPGRHDPCVLPRAVPIVEAMAALTLADAALAQMTQKPLP